MKYFLMLVLLPAVVQAMDFDIEAIKKHSSEKFQDLSAKLSFSEQEKKDYYSYWFTLLSLVPFLESKKENNPEAMKQNLDKGVAPVLNNYHSQKIVLKLNPFKVRDSNGEYPLDLMKESIQCGATLCCISCINHDSCSTSQYQEIRKKLIDWQSQGQDRDSLTQLLLLAKPPAIEYHSSGYGDSF